MNYAPTVAASAQLSFLGIQHRLAAAPRALELATFRTRLERDYQRVDELLRQSPGGCRHFPAAELSLLRVHYRISLGRDNVSVTLRGVPSRTALRDVSEIVAFLANIAGAARYSAPSPLKN